MAEAAAAPTRSCITCLKLESDLGEKLKNCSKCPDTLYCSRECQKADWKQHKRVCASQQKSAHSPGFHAVNNFILGLGPDSGLHQLSKKDVFTRLIDCFRMRVEDEYVYGGDAIGLYNGENPHRDFRKFLDLAESRSNFLPPWWNKEKRKECERLSVSKDCWSNINFSVEKHDIQEHYKNSLAPMELRILGEKIYGRGIM